MPKRSITIKFNINFDYGFVFHDLKIASRPDDFIPVEDMVHPKGKLYLRKQGKSTFQEFKNRLQEELLK